MGFLFYACVFFIVVFLIYYFTTNSYKVYVLCASSIVFIAAFSFSVALFSLLFTLMNYFLGIMLEKSNSRQSTSTKLFWISIFLNVGVLAFFKYFNFFSDGIDSLFFSSGIYSHVPYLSVMIPIGISYYTFQSLGYLIRINRGSEKAEHNFGSFATYLLFFPKFLSGPVARSNHFLPQLNKPLSFDRNDVDAGARLFLWGLFKKIVIADSLYGPVSQVYSDVHQYTGIPLVIVLIVQTIYIYCDFSGYTDMALGVAKIFGINLVDNFNRPFLARNVSEFWRRWHISLSSWCNDFIYNPFIVKYRRFGNQAVITGIFLTFFIVGIWHGANLTFVILGILQGVAIVYEFRTKRTRLKIASRFPKKVVNTLSRIIVFLFMAFSMVFFFSNSVGDAWYLISHLFSGIQFDLKEIVFIDNKPAFLFALFCFLILFIIEILNEKGRNLLSLYLQQPAWIRGAGYLTCGLLIYLFYSGFEPFYYMRF
jgi:D-alanyl-lipoteichoic acid acyltransferase DltB (MBOAT superfamily)